MSFIGRKTELELLRIQRKKKVASLVVVTGRRRIGKSTLVHKFSEEFQHFFEFQGIAPRPELNNKNQLKTFAEQCKLHFEGAEPILNNWTEAFAHIDKELKGKKNVLLFIDEISWLARYDKDFVGKLKIAWDTMFSRNPELLLILCGSVSAWIEDNILQETDFVGRVSQTIRLRELSLAHSLDFWGPQGGEVSERDRLRFLNVAGGIPKYLEEFTCADSVNENVLRLCFSEGGYLFEDFDKIFVDIFERRSETYKQVVRTLVRRHLSPNELAKELKVNQSGELTRCLRDLELSGFISRDYTFKPGGSKSKLSKLRICDNYLRFYLKYIEPNISAIEKGIYRFNGLGELLAWESISGLQFESLIVNRIPEIIQLLGLERETILSAGPYFQNNTSKTKAVQIDLLIECKPNNFFICEIKFKQRITKSVIAEVQDKVSRVRLPKYSTRRPVLIYSGDLDLAVAEADYFNRILHIG